ncbi:MAG: PQQ-binding-like beta-propeller repeat protein, partial [Myxococcales bacterium]|nr:PQQ-binding-like beta-propeller repeat protein [Myxococcales bacterium]
DVDPDEGLFTVKPLVGGGRVWLPIYYCVAGYSRVVIAEFDGDSRTLLGMVAPEGLGDPRECALAPATGTLAWAVADGVALASLFAVEQKRPEPKATPKPKPKNSAKVLELGPPVADEAQRRGCFAGTIGAAPTLKWARAEYQSGADEFGGSVTAGEGLAVGCHNGQVCALSLAKGETRWITATAKSRSWATSRIAIAGGKVYLSTNHGLNCLDATSGALDWQAKIPGATGAPLVFADHCLIGGAKGLHLRSQTKAGHKQWSYPVRDAVLSAPAWAEDRIYFYADAALHCIEASSQQAVWSLPAAAPRHAGPMVIGDLLVYLAEFSTLAAVDRHDGAARWRIDL